jgi:hypothetical protein
VSCFHLHLHQLCNLQPHNFQIEHSAIDDRSKTKKPKGREDTVCYTWQSLILICSLRQTTQQPLRSSITSSIAANRRPRSSRSQETGRELLEARRARRSTKSSSSSTTPAAQLSNNISLSSRPSFDDAAEDVSMIDPVLLQEPQTVYRPSINRILQSQPPLLRLPHLPELTHTLAQQMIATQATDSHLPSLYANPYVARSADVDTPNTNLYAAQDCERQSFLDQAVSAANSPSADKVFTVEWVHSMDRPEVASYIQTDHYLSQGGRHYKPSTNPRIYPSAANYRDWVRRVYSLTTAAGPNLPRFQLAEMELVYRNTNGQRVRVDVLSGNWSQEAYEGLYSKLGGEVVFEFGVKLLGAGEMRFEAAGL